MTAVAAPNKVERLQQIFALAQTRNTNSDEVFVLNNISWEQFNAVLDIIPEQRGTLFRYLEGVLEIMAPNRNHEWIKKILGLLLECYFIEKEIDFFPLGSTTFKNQLLQRGIEPDECYCFGQEKEFPDLVIEVVITSGGLNLLDIYRGLGVQEVWFWEQEKLSIFTFENDNYTKVSQSVLLPDLKKEVLEQFLVSSDSPLNIRRAFRQQIV